MTESRYSYLSSFRWILAHVSSIVTDLDNMSGCFTSIIVLLRGHNIHAHAYIASSKTKTNWQIYMLKWAVNIQFKFGRTEKCMLFVTLFDMCAYNPPSMTLTQEQEIEKMHTKTLCAFETQKCHAEWYFYGACVNGSSSSGIIISVIHDIARHGQFKYYIIIIKY